MAEVNREDVLAALSRVTDPDAGRDVVSLGIVQGLVIRNGHVGLSLEIEPKDAERKAPLRAACEQAVAKLPGVLSATVVLTAERAQDTTAPGHAAAPQGGAGAKPARPALPGIGAVIAVASAKGGVGKSTTAVNLAVAMAKLGARVGLLDCDIYGPSIPRMMRLSGMPQSTDGKTMKPMESYGVRVMSIGFLVDEDTPMIWRGPMVMGALEQMLRDVEWGELDVLVCDMPPGTGDAQLTMAQRVPLAGAVIVSTPQDIALLDAVRGINMFRRVDVPVLGIIENMSYFVCPKCGERTEIFHHGGARQTAVRLGVEFLGEIPLDIDIRTTSDDGRPIVLSAPDSPHAKSYLGIAGRVLDAAKGAAAARKAPHISMA